MLQDRRPRSNPRWFAGPAETAQEYHQSYPILLLKAGLEKKEEVERLTSPHGTVTELLGRSWEISHDALTADDDAHLDWRSK